MIVSNYPNFSPRGIGSIYFERNSFSFLVELNGLSSEYVFVKSSLEERWGLLIGYDCKSSISLAVTISFEDGLIGFSFGILNNLV